MLKAKAEARRYCSEEMTPACDSGVTFAFKRSDETGGPKLSRQLAYVDCEGEFNTVRDIVDCQRGAARFYKSMRRIGRRND